MPSHCNLFASGMKFTLEILAAPEEVKFATSFTSFFRESFCFQVIPKQVSSPTHFSLCGIWDSTPSLQGAFSHPDSPSKGGKRRFRQFRWGWAGFHIQRWKSRGSGVTAFTGQSSWWGNRLSPAHKPRKTLMSLHGNLAPIFLRPSFFGNMLTFFQEEPKTKWTKDVRVWLAVGATLMVSADQNCHCCIQIPVPNWKSESCTNNFFFSYYHINWCFCKDVRLFNDEIVNVINAWIKQQQKSLNGGKQLPLLPLIRMSG